MNKQTSNKSGKNMPKRTKNRIRNMRRSMMRRRLRRAIRRTRRNQIPIAKTKNFKRTMNNTTISATTARVSGQDLVYTIPDVMPQTSDAMVIAVIPSNPAYWLGTKIATIARGYQNYRPVRFTVHYVPHCAATQAGNIIGGTIFHEAPASNNIQQSLKTSNGGIMTQVFKPATAKVKVGTNLQKNLYRVGGDIDDDSMPFYYIGIAIACKDSNNNRVMPGYFYVSYTYIFKNPIGGSVDFANSGITQFASQLATMKKGNVSAMLCEQFQSEAITLAIGTVLDVEYSTEDQAWRFYYNGTLINTPNTYLWVLSNEQANALNNNQMQARVKQPIDVTTKFENEPEDSWMLSPGSAYVYQVGNVIHTLLNLTNDFKFVTFSDQVKNFYFAGNQFQDFGTLSSFSTTDVSQFMAQATKKFINQVISNKIDFPEHIRTSKFHQYAKIQHTGKASWSILPEEQEKADAIKYITGRDREKEELEKEAELLNKQLANLSIQPLLPELAEEKTKQEEQLTKKKKKRKEKEPEVDYTKWDPEKEYYNRQPDPNAALMPELNHDPEDVLSQQEIQEQVQGDYDL